MPAKQYLDSSIKFLSGGGTFGGKYKPNKWFELACI
jgi:hypothetical protein